MIHVVEYPKPVDWAEDARRRNAAYQAAHAACPKCGGSDFWETTMQSGYPDGPDRNRCRCLGCGWRGIVDERAAGTED